MSEERYCPRCSNELNDEGYCSECKVYPFLEYIEKPTIRTTEEEMEDLKEQLREAMAKTYLLTNWDKFVTVEEEKREDGKAIRLKETGEKREFVTRAVKGEDFD